jgi:hypothetical protein
LVIGFLLGFCLSTFAFSLLVLGPFAKPESLDLPGLIAGTTIGVALGLWGYLLDGMEVRE